MSNILRIEHRDSQDTVNRVFMICGTDRDAVITASRKIQKMENTFGMKVSGVEVLHRNPIDYFFSVTVSTELFDEASDAITIKIKSLAGISLWEEPIENEVLAVA